MLIVLENVLSEITLMCIKEMEKVACKRFYHHLLCIHQPYCLHIYEKTYARHIFLYKPDKQSG